MTPILYTIADESPKLSKLIESEYDKYKWVNDYRLGNKEIYKVISEFEVARDANQAIENELKKSLTKNILSLALWEHLYLFLNQVHVIII